MALSMGPAPPSPNQDHARPTRNGTRMASAWNSRLDMPLTGVPSGAHQSEGKRAEVFAAEVLAWSRAHEFAKTFAQSLVSTLANRCIAAKFKYEGFLYGSQLSPGFRFPVLSTSHFQMRPIRSLARTR